MLESSTNDTQEPRALIHGTGAKVGLLAGSRPPLPIEMQTAEATRTPNKARVGGVSPLPEGRAEQGLIWGPAWRVFLSRSEQTHAACPSKRSGDGLSLGGRSLSCLRIIVIIKLGIRPPRKCCGRCSPAPAKESVWAPNFVASLSRSHAVPCCPPGANPPQGVLLDPLPKGSIIWLIP